jgi:hypothetical protein
MSDDPKSPRPPAGMTFEEFTEKTLGAVFRAAKAHRVWPGPIVVGVMVDPGKGLYGGTQMVTCGFAAVVKPFFTDCYRSHMLFLFDLWDPNAVKQHWQAIHDAVQSGAMPAGGCPGTFNKDGFLEAFQCWKDQGFPP